MKNLLKIIGYVIGILVAVLGIFALVSLIIWGIGNAIIYLFTLPATWTYWKSCVTTFLIWGIRQIVKSYIR